MAKNKKKKDYKEYKKYKDKKLEKLKERAKKKNKTIVLDTTEQKRPQYKKGYSEDRDKKKKALPPGKRISKKGNIYYAYRKDHTDKGIRKV